MASQLEELLPFLHSEIAQARSIALSNLLSFTPIESPHRDVFFRGLGSSLDDNHPIRDLKILCRDQLDIAHDAFRALVNLSDSLTLCKSLSEPSFLTFLVSYILDPAAILADLASMLLSNMTSSPDSCFILVDLKIPVILNQSSPKVYHTPKSHCGSCMPTSSYAAEEQLDVAALPLLLDAFLEGRRYSPDEGAAQRKGDLHFLASVFANIAVTDVGRAFFLTPQPSAPLVITSEVEYPLAKIATFTEHSNAIRRRGVVSVLRNCCFNVAAHKALLTSEKRKLRVHPSDVEAPGISLLPFLLLPLAGPEEFDLEGQERLPPELQLLPATKERESEPSVRQMLVESLLLLCTTHWGRNQLRMNGVYEIIRAAHENEEVDRISGQMEELVNLMKREERPETARDEVFGDGDEAVTIYD